MGDIFNGTKDSQRSKHPSKDKGLKLDGTGLAKEQAQSVAKLEVLFIGKRGSVSGSPLLNAKYVTLGFALASIRTTKLDHMGTPCCV